MDLHSSEVGSSKGRGIRTEQAQSPMQRLRWSDLVSDLGAKTTSSRLGTLCRRTDPLLLPQEGVAIRRLEGSGAPPRCSWSLPFKRRVGIGEPARHIPLILAQILALISLDVFNYPGFTLRSSLGGSKMSLYEKTYIIVTIVTLMMALSCLTYLDGDL